MSDYEHYQHSIFQKTIISMMISDPVAWARCAAYFQPQYFNDDLKRAISYITDYQRDHGLLPAAEQIVAHTGVTVEKFSEPAMHADALIVEFEQLVRFRAMENVILNSLDDLNAGNFAAVRDGFTAAHDIRITADGDHPFEGLWIDEFEQVEPPEYLIRNWLVKDTVTCVYGAPGSYKSFWCIEAGFCLAAGIPFAGKAVHQTSVAYVAAEGQRGLAQRVEALCEAHKVRSARNSFRLITRPLSLLDDAEVGQFIAYLKDLQHREGIAFGLVVLDTYSQCIAGADENAQATASKASSNMIRIRRELETTVIYVHHTGKDEHRGMRGSDALRANTDGAVEIIRDDHTCGNSPATAIVRRSKDARIGDRQRFLMKFQKIARLAGQEFDGSLVPEFVAEEAIRVIPLPDEGQKLGWLEDLVIQMELDQKVSVKKALTMTGRSASTHYKDKLAGLLPLNMGVDVRDMDGDVIGQLMRVASERADNQYGDIQCVAKSGVA